MPLSPSRPEHTHSMASCAYSRFLLAHGQRLLSRVDTFRNRLSGDLLYGALVHSLSRNSDSFVDPQGGLILR
jgi:hypothetical protein